jgi:DNA-binding transcriptional ArsR family regulator
MCIAPTLRAVGEGDLHPFETEPLVTDTTNLPWVILRAVHRAAQLDGISTRARAVLAALARTVDANKPFGEIFARRTLLSERAMQSERTFYRSLVDLEAAGLVERPPQRRYVEAGLFGRAYLHLTRKAAELLGLNEAKVTPLDETEHGTAMSDVQGFEAPSANVADGANTKDLNPIAFQKRQPGQVPQDLQRLRTLGFLDFLIFKLMREAREAGKRLSDVVEVCWQHLSQAKHPISYVRALLASTTDFGHQLRAKTAARSAAQAAACEREATIAALQALNGQTFIDRRGQTRYTVTDAGTTLMVYNVVEGVVRRAVGQWTQGFVKAIKEGQITARTYPGRTCNDADAAVGHAVIEHQPVAPAQKLTASVVNHLSQLRRLCRRA